VQVSRHGDRHGLKDVEVAIRFEGHYDESYTDGDNRHVLPTDTMRNTVYAMAARQPVSEPESFGLALTSRFLDRNPRLQRVRIDLTEHPWRRIRVGDTEHGHAFMRPGAEARTATVQASREGSMVGGGLRNLLILKSAHSAFADFLRDELTTLPDTQDRLFATSLRASWRYVAADVDFATAWHAVRRRLLEAFAEHDSKSVQHTLYAMGEAVLDSCEEVTEIRLVMPNKHHLPIDLTRLGIENRNEIFVPTDEPYGLIEAVMRR
jgi:urate oxidase